MTGCAGSKRVDIPNFRPVGNGVYRGGQPTAAGWGYLRSIGVTNVVKLNEDSEGSDGYAERLGMTVNRFPISIIQQTIGEPCLCEVLTAVGCIKPGTYVHCSHGQDRTGLVIALYRVRCGWSRKDAEKEMLDDGFHTWLRGLYWGREDSSE